VRKDNFAPAFSACAGDRPRSTRGSDAIGLRSSCPGHNLLL